MADEELTGRVAEGADKDQETYLSLFKKAADELLAPFERSTIDLTQTGDELLHCDAIFRCKAKEQKRRQKTTSPGIHHRFSPSLLVVVSAV